MFGDILRMNAHWIGFIVFLAIIGLLLGSIPVGEPLVLNSTLMQETKEPYINYMLSYTQAWQDNPWGTLVNPVMHTKFFQALFNVLLQTKTRNALFPEGSPWIIVWWIFWIPIIATVVFGVVMIFIYIIQRVIS